MSDIRHTRRGEIVFDGKVLPTNDAHRLGKDDAEYQKMLRYYEPPFEDTLKEVVREVAMMRAHGQVRPFVEGEPIGKYVKPPRKPRVTDVQVREYNRRRSEWARQEMLELRRNNDATLKSLRARYL